MKTPKQVLMEVEDNVDHPPHTISERLADLALEALERHGFRIIRYRVVDDDVARRA